MANVATYYLNDTLKTAREAEVTAADFDGGMNRGGSNACGIGIASANGQCKTEDWTVVDQHGAARDPQDSQHIGEGTGVGTIPINAIGTLDTDTVSLTVEATGWVVNTTP